MNTLKISSIIMGYYTPQIDVRGTCTALYDYAICMKEIYGIVPIILTPLLSQQQCDQVALDKFKKFEIVHFNVTGDGNVDSVTMDKVIKDNYINVLYMIKYGKNDNLYSRIVPTCIHCVFDMDEPHGTIYAAVSSTLAKKYGKSQFVPHMVRLKAPQDGKILTRNGSTLREDLGIPKTARVFGRYGGMDTFNLEFARIVISNIVREYEDIYFLFINTPVFDKHPRIIHLDKISTDDQKIYFIQACDAYLEAGTMGHTFGLAIAEFSVNNKPVIAYDNPHLWNRAHLDILGDDYLRYRYPLELHNILANFTPQKYKNMYQDYMPDIVCKKFYDVFIKNVL